MPLLNSLQELNRVKWDSIVADVAALTPEQPKEILLKINEIDYLELVSFARHRLWKKNKDKSLLNAKEIVHEVYLKCLYEPFDKSQFKREINKYLLYLKIFPRTIYLTLSADGTVWNPPFYEDAFKFCRHCRQIKSANAFGTFTRYETGLTGRLDNCKECVSLKARLKKLGEGKSGRAVRKIYANRREQENAAAARFYAKNKERVNKLAREKYLKAKMKLQEETGKSLEKSTEVLTS